MGFSPSLFIDEPNQELICAICHDVQDTPTSCPCGHTFCDDCLDEWTDRNLGTNKTCPTCRFSLEHEDDEDDEYGLNIDHNKALHRMIHNMQVKCPNNHDHTDAYFQNARSNEEERACQRRKLDERGGSQDIYKPSSSDERCTWIGCLGDWQEKHKEECHLEEIQCVVPGCEFECLRKDMDEHLDKGSGRLEHMQLMVKQETQKIRESIIEELEENF
jgi:hypothetical protein